MPRLLHVVAMKTRSSPASLSRTAIVHPALVAVASLSAGALAGPIAGVALALVGLRLGVMFSAAAGAEETAPRAALRPLRA